LRSISTAQAQFQAAVELDCDGDGAGEYGTLEELAGTVALRDGTPALAASPYVATILGVTDASGYSQKSGYYFALYLIPATPEQPEPGWRCYAWPNTRGQSGNRAFYVDHHGSVMATPNTTAKFSGVGAAPPPGPIAAETWVPAGN
jgi:hypothetical protein